MISFQIKPWVAFGFPHLLIELFYIGMPVVRTDGRSLPRCTVTWWPNFLGWVDYHISLAKGLRPCARFVAKYCQTPLNLLWSSYCEIRAEPYCGQKYGQFAKQCHRPFIHRFPLVYLCVACKQHFGVLTVKFLLNLITTHKMESLENVVTRLRIIVLCYSYNAYHQNDTLELLPWNCHLTPLWPKRWPICKILSHASKSSFSFS